MSDDLDFPTVRSNLEKRLNYCFTQHESAVRRFVRNGKTREIFDTDRLDSLFRSLFSLENDSQARETYELRLRSTIRIIRGKSGTSNPGCCNILATLLYTRCRSLTLQAFERRLHNGEAQNFNDDSLPFEQPDCIRFFGDDDGPRFWDGQMPFCPVRFKQNDQVSYVGTRASSRLPFVKELAQIGEGSYGIVYKGIIEKGHLINRKNEAPLGRKAYAIKKFKNYDAGIMETEGAIVQQIVQATKKHNNILVTRASLHIGKSYYHVFDLARYDMWRFFKDRSNPPLGIFTSKMSFLGCFIGLAGGLAYLHDELSIALPERNQLLRCYHLDLKPQNVLVFDEDGKMILRFTDFGISRIKHIEPHSLSDDSDSPFHSLDKICRPSPLIESTTGVKNSRYGGTYAAPEAVNPNGKVTRKSDVWGFGTVLTLAMTYMQDGWDGIVAFAKARSLNRDDRFFDMPTNAESSCVLHPSVTKQLNKLTEKAANASDIEGSVFRLMSDLISNKMLCPQGTDRVYAKQVEDSLRSIHSTFSKQGKSLTRHSHHPGLSQYRSSPASIAGLIPHEPLLAPLERSRTLPEPHIFTAEDCSFTQQQMQSHRPNPGRFLRRIKAVFSRESQVRYDLTPLRLPYVMRICKLSLDGRHLAIGGEDLIVIIPVADIQPEQLSPIFVGLSPPEGQQWTDFAISTDYLCVAVDAGCFECTFIPLSKDSTTSQRTVSRSAEAPIYRVAISANTEYTAFVLRDMQQNDNALRLMFYRTRDVIAITLARYSPMLRNDTPATPSSLDAEKLDSEFMWPSVMSHPEELDLPAGADIFDMKFSQDGSTFVLLTRPYQQGQDLQYDVITWDLDKGRRLSHFCNVDKSVIDADNLWKPTSYALFPSAPRYAVTSNKRIRIGDFTVSTGDWRARTESLDDEIMDVLIPEDKQQLIILGRAASDTEVKAFQISENAVDGMTMIPCKGISTGLREYCVGTDSFRVRIDPGTGRRQLLVARLEIEGRTCLLSTTYLD